MREERERGYSIGTTLCVVCSEAYKDGEEVTWMACQHLFHAACLRPWLEVRPPSSSVILPPPPSTFPLPCFRDPEPQTLNPKRQVPDEVPKPGRYA